MATLECSAIAVPFLCQYSLSLCKGNQLFSPTRESCFKLRDFCFSDSWLVVEKQKNYGYLLPNCSTLPPGIDCYTPACTCTIPVIFIGNFSITKDKNLTCPEMFINNGKDCQPECGKFKQFSSSVDVFTQTSTLVAAIVGILSSLLVIFLHCHVT